MTLVGCAFAAALVATAAIDFDHQIIPDEISLGGLARRARRRARGALARGRRRSARRSRARSPARCSAAALLWIVGFVHARVSAALGRRFEHWPGEGEALPRLGSLDYWTWFPGVGFGDVKLLAMIGAVLGPFGVLETIVLASLVGLAFGALVDALAPHLEHAVRVRARDRGRRAARAARAGSVRVAAGRADGWRRGRGKVPSRQRSPVV